MPRITVCIRWWTAENSQLGYIWQPAVLRLKGFRSDPQNWRWTKKRIPEDLSWVHLTACCVSVEGPLLCCIWRSSSQIHKMNQEENPWRPILGTFDSLLCCSGKPSGQIHILDQQGTCMDPIPGTFYIVCWAAANAVRDSQVGWSWESRGIPIRVYLTA